MDWWTPEFRHEVIAKQRAWKRHRGFLSAEFEDVNNVDSTRFFTSAHDFAEIRRYYKHGVVKENQFNLVLSKKCRWR